MGRHVVLCGDSIFDNAAYVDGGPDVAAQLRAILREEDMVTHRAVDGSITSQLAPQLASLPADATHLVVSIGGNDILHHAALLERQVGTIASALAILGAAARSFLPNIAPPLLRLVNVEFPLRFAQSTTQTWGR